MNGAGLHDRDRGPDADTLKAVLRYLDGVASADEVAQLTARLRSSAIDRRGVAGLLLQLGTIEDLGRASAAKPLVDAHIPVPQAAGARSSRGAWIGAGATVVALAGLIAAIRSPVRTLQTPVSPTSSTSPVVAADARSRRLPHLLPPPIFADGALARVESLTGKAFAITDGARRDLDPGARLAVDDGVEIEAGPGARVALAFADGTALELAGEGLISRLSAEEVPGQGQPRLRVQLERGSSIATLPARPSGSAIAFVTPRAEIQQRAGELRVAIQPQATKVWLRSGAAEVRRRSDDQRVALEPGRSVSISETSAALVVVEGPRALLVRGSGARGAPLDRQLGARLESQGFTVSGVDEARLEPGDLAGKALIVISSTSDGRVLAARLPATGLRDLPVPVVNCESLAFAPLGMTTLQGVGQKITELFIEQPAHPLAAGKTGRVRIASVPVAANWAQPASTAIGIATLKSRRRYVVYAYERGTAMVGLTAPARRASCFLDSKRTEPLTESAWEFFDAAVRWAAELPAEQQSEPPM